MTDQEIVDRLAVLAAPRLAGLLRLRSTRHVWEMTPGYLQSELEIDGVAVTFNRSKTATQPYRRIERFLGDDKVMPYLVDPGLLPLATALSKDAQGKAMLATRWWTPRLEERGACGFLDGFGVRIRLYAHEDAGDTMVEWSCLYGVA